jgi:hypothetical protein
VPATYADQVQKLDVRSLMAAAFKARPGHHYTVYRDADGWHPADRSALPPAPELLASIAVDRPPVRGGPPPRSAEVILKVLAPDGRQYQQMLCLLAAPTRNGRLSWTTFCPCSHRQARTLYFSLMGPQQFVSRQVAGLGYRKPGKTRNQRLRMFAIMRELEADHAGPCIPRPIWMSEPHYEALIKELLETDIRRLSAALGRPPPNFGGEPLAYAEIKPKRVRYPASTVLFCVKNGVRQLKARYRPRYGLPVSSP